MGSGRRGVRTVTAPSYASPEMRNRAQCIENEVANLHKMEASPARGRTTNREHVLIVRGTAKMCSGKVNEKENIKMKSLLPGSAPLMQNGVHGHETGVSAMIIARQRETRCHGGQGQGSVGLRSMGERNVRFWRTKQRKTISPCTQKSRFAVSFPAAPVLPP